MRFSKYHGTGNDFILVEDLDDVLHLTPGLISALCDRHLGVGADGLIRIAPGSPAEGSDLFMDYSNADGSVAEMCGNGIRCVAAYAKTRGLVAGDRISVGTRAGLKVLDVAGPAADPRVTVDMGSPVLDPEMIPVASTGLDRVVAEPLRAGGRTWRATAVSMGNPHCVVSVEEDPVDLDLARLGPPIERHELFPNGANVEFVRVHEDVIRARVWERGVGETLACGTGACAALVACALTGATARAATVEFPGGRLWVEWGEDSSVRLTGPATHVFDGETSGEWDEAAGAGRVSRAVAAG